jgi:transcription initiation factor TFIIIB Brf1 subunit/transcription initiation factor TFIIB
MSTSERNLNDGFHNIRTYETMFSLPRLVVNSSRDLMAEYEKKKDKTMHGARSEAFALAVVFLAMSMHGTGKTLKEVAGISKVEERDIRSHIKRIRKTIPQALAKTTSPEEFIRVIVADIEAPFLLERLSGVAGGPSGGDQGCQGVGCGWRSDGGRRHGRAGVATHRWSLGGYV